MKRKMWLLLVIVPTMLMIQACSRMVKSEDDCHFVKNSVGQRVSWGDQVPVKLNIHQSVSSYYYSAIYEAAEQWNKLMGKQLIEVNLTGVGGDIPTGRDGHNTIYMLNDWDKDKPSEQARTSVYWKGNQIIEADIRINAKNFSYSNESQAELGKVDMMSLILHEMGHVLGLAHLSEEESVMLTQLAKGEERREPIYGGPDFHALKCEY